MPSPPVNINKTQTKKRVLIAPLDWGLGHATRCVPLIHELLKSDFEVLIAAETAGARLLQIEFPGLKILPLEGYRVSYSKKKKWFLLKMLTQFPKIAAAVKREHEWLQQCIGENNIDVVISDNRYGLWSKKVKTIFITHQLFINTGNRLTDFFAQKINYRFINRFDECWVPDKKENGGLAGKLSHPSNLPSLPIRYIGTLSRFEKTNAEKNIDLLILLSGPEPQRTCFEDILLEQLKTISLKTVLLRGLPHGGKKINSVNGHIKIIDHLPAAALNELLAAAAVIIARSGYSTIMDLAATQSKAILVPTPGQSEQEYLALYLEEKKHCFTETQAAFDLKAVIQKIKSFDFVPFPAAEKKLLGEAVTALR